jgi:SpoVK/Ycf46/Vps4 family AAA+-type ATPase
LIRVLLKTNHHLLSDHDIRTLAKETDGFSGADLKALSTDAAMGPIRQLGAKALEVSISDVPPISYRHFRQSLKGMKPSVSPDDLVQYIEWDKIYGTKTAPTNDESDSDSDGANDDAALRINNS